MLKEALSASAAEFGPEHERVTMLYHEIGNLLDSQVPDLYRLVAPLACHSDAGGAAGQVYGSHRLLPPRPPARSPLSSAPSSNSTRASSRLPAWQVNS